VTKRFFELSKAQLYKRRSTQKLVSMLMEFRQRKKDEMVEKTKKTVEKDLNKLKKKSRKKFF